MLPHRAVAEARGIHSGKEHPPAKEPLNISEVRLTFVGFALFNKFLKFRRTLVAHNFSMGSNDTVELQLL